MTNSAATLTRPAPGAETEEDPGLCFRGHSLREHGERRKDRPSWKCRACCREWARARRRRKRNRSEYGWRGDEHMCLHLYEVCVPDESAVLRLMAGDGRPGPVHLVDKIEAIRRLDRQGFSAAVIAERTGCASRTVVRMRGRIKEDKDYGTTGE